MSSSQRYVKVLQVMDVSKLKPGDNHYMAYVGPPAQYDFMGASQFRLLCTLGLRAHHRFLDFGCGSLRGGRFFINYLNEGCYHGIEPNRWLIEEAIKCQVGQDLVNIKKPKFDHNETFTTGGFSTHFDFILAQSIFSHTGSELAVKCLKNFKESLNDHGLIIVTFVEGDDDFEGKGWVYPQCVHFRSSTIQKFAIDAGLVMTPIPWYHPRQTWYVFAKHEGRLPSADMKAYLKGAVLFDAEFSASCNDKRTLTEDVKESISNLHRTITARIKRIFNIS
jgi:SAM-dependent methyltransferase